jgi:hypothetical protein
VDTARALELGAEANSGGELDNRWLVLDIFGLLDSGLNSLEIVVTIRYVLGVPSVGFKSLEDIFGERNFGIAICIMLASLEKSSLTVRTNGNMVVIIDSNQVAKLQVSSNGSSLASNTFLCTPITEEHIGVVVNQVKTWLVELCSSVSLSNGKTNSVAKSLSQRTCGDFDARGVVGLGVARCDAVYSLLRN